MTLVTYPWSGLHMGPYPLPSGTGFTWPTIEAGRGVRLRGLGQDTTSTGDGFDVGSFLSDLVSGATKAYQSTQAANVAEANAQASYLKTLALSQSPLATSSTANLSSMMPILLIGGVLVMMMMMMKR